MTLPALIARSASEIGADASPGESCADLDFWIWYENLPRLKVPTDRFRDCQNCGPNAHFHADRVCAQGEVGKCMRCGELVLAAWTRTNSEEIA